MQKIKNYCNVGQTAFNRSVSVRRLTEARLRKTTVGCALGARTPFVWFCSATFFCARKNAYAFSLIGRKKTSFTAKRYRNLSFAYNSKTSIIYEPKKIPVSFYANEKMYTNKKFAYITNPAFMRTVVNFL